MDGFDEMVETESWASLTKAKQALFDVQRAFERDGYVHSGAIYEARCKLTDAENQLRFYFKHKSRGEEA